MRSLGPDVGYAARESHLPASAGDRELVIDSLKAAFTQGRLSQSELDRRVVQVLESRTYGGLADATAGIPPVGAFLPPQGVEVMADARRPAPACGRAARWKTVAWVLALAIGVPGLGVAFVATVYGSFFVMLSVGFAAAAALGSPSVRRHHQR